MEKIAYSIAFPIPVLIFFVGISINDSAVMYSGLVLLMFVLFSYIGTHTRKYKTVNGVIARRKLAVVIPMLAVALIAIVAGLILDRLLIGCVVGCIVGIFSLWYWLKKDKVASEK